MDDLAAAFLGPGDDASIQEEDEGPQGSGTENSTTTARTLRRGILKAANLQDKLLEKLLAQVIPVDDGQPHEAGSGADSSSSFGERPGFTVGAMSNNFRRFNARIGVVFKFQAKALRVLSWRRPTHTLSLLAVYTFICLDPYLIFVLPLAIALFGIFVPSFIARHPAPASSSEAHTVRNLGYSPRGPPLAPARTFKPTKELSRDFFRNLGDLQNVMDDYSVAHDKIIALVVPKTNFSDEALSSAIFVLLCGACALMTVTAHLIHWRYIMLVVGWAAIWSNHPTVSRLMTEWQAQYLGTDPSEKSATDKAVHDNDRKLEQIQNNPPGPDPNSGSAMERAFDAWVRSDIILDDAPETREVEIFELQRLSDTSGEWEPWLFSPSPYDPLSAARIAGDRPTGTRFFEDVLPPEGWEWSGKKWALDLWSREWVEERIITGVEVETEGERWVYDIYNEHENGGSGGGDPNDDLNAALGDGDYENPVRSQDQSRHMTTPKIGPTISWEEGEEGMGRRGSWRRRRWVRMVKRKNVNNSASN
ncbi:Peroxin/Dysferlin domain-containing protein [Sordaria brevicollis]|uniref:Peroxin/Dysferlin domain-containing protein n=1 Tax=Sordaria brevicollis TaxID=83679 RepID=A0AAE0PNC4_SORBR|nr:Peroxin/Dysferlin domain-containing protein [Sordaria brevicollis]